MSPDWLTTEPNLGNARAARRDARLRQDLPPLPHPPDDEIRLWVGGHSPRGRLRGRAPGRCANRHPTPPPARFVLQPRARRTGPGRPRTTGVGTHRVRTELRPRLADA